MKILVTGAAGFLGARLAEVLLEGGHQVCGFDILDGEEPPGWQEARLAGIRDNPGFTFVQGDVCDPASMESALADQRPGVVVHLASRHNLVWADEIPPACLRLHVEGTAVVLGACQRKHVKQVVIGSSSHVYGGSRQYPFSESDPANRPLSVLGAAQRSAELFAHAFALQSPVSVSVLRLFSLYGPRQSPSSLLPALVEAAEHRVPMPVIGDGTSSRDMIYVDDAVVGILRVLDRPAPWQIYNLGSGETTTLDQVAQLVSFAMDVELQRKRLPLRPGEMPHTYADIKQASKSIGFGPTVSLEDGIHRYIDWYRTRSRAFRTIKGHG